MNRLKKFLIQNVLLFATFLVMVFFMMAISAFSGYFHGAEKMRLIMIHFALLCGILFVLNDPIKFLVLAVDKAWWPRQMATHTVDKNATVHTRSNYLQMKIKALRYQLVATDKHCNEYVNLKYQYIANDLWLYGRYFLTLMCLVLVVQDEMLYYNTSFMTDVFTKNQTRSWGLKAVRSFEDTYKFIISTVVAAYEPDVKKTGYYRWIYGDFCSMLGVARLRQLRRRDNYHMGWDEHEFANIDYMPKWELPYQRVFYTDKYWRIYEPWLPIYPTYTTMNKLLMNFDHEGYIQNYPELYGYTTLLARSYNNSMKVIHYLKSMDWLTDNSVMLFIDFTLYNVDAQMYTVVTMKIERTPFGSVLGTVDITSTKFFKPSYAGNGGIMIVGIYIYMLILFTKKFIVDLWYEPARFTHDMWYVLDLLIITLNMLGLIMLMLMGYTVSSRLKLVESSSKLNFISFIVPSRLVKGYNIVEGFLVCLTTLRLWRVLQFASVFQMMTSTLYTAFKPLLSTALIIVIFLTAYGMTVAIINGNYTITFCGMSKSIASSLCFAFGFTTNISPTDLFHGGKVLGGLLYFILAFVIMILLMNLFATTINDNFAKVRRKRDAEPQDQINFLQFLKVEYATFFHIFKKLPCCKRGYKRNNRTVSENINSKLESMVYSSKKSFRMAFNSRRQLTSEGERYDRQRHEKYKERIEKMYHVAALMQIQMQLLEHALFDREVSNVDADLPDDEIEMESESEVETLVEAENETDTSSDEGHRKRK